MFFKIFLRSAQFTPHVKNFQRSYLKCSYIFNSSWTTKSSPKYYYRTTIT